MLIFITLIFVSFLLKQRSVLVQFLVGLEIFVVHLINAKLLDVFGIEWHQDVQEVVSVY